MRHVTKCVVPAAGLGTRFLSATKAVPKELLPIVDTPTLQLLVEECNAAKITDVLLVTARGKSSMVDHFDLSPELEEILGSRGKQAELDALRRISGLARITTTRQHEPLGPAGIRGHGMRAPFQRAVGPGGQGPALDRHRLAGSGAQGEGRVPGQPPARPRHAKAADPLELSWRLLRVAERRRVERVEKRALAQNPAYAADDRFDATPRHG